MLSFTQIAMSILHKEEQLTLIEKLSMYDYIRFCWPDLNGITRGRTVMGRYAAKAVKEGLNVFSGMLSMGPGSEITELEILKQKGHGNIKFVPASKLYDITWADKKYRVGKIICEAFWLDGTPIEADPRTVAKRQLARLKSAGLRLYSGFEVECFIVDSLSSQPVFSNLKHQMDVTVSEQSAWIYDLETYLRDLNINIDTIHTELGPGQFEFCMVPKYGIDILDDLFIMKYTMREILPNHGCKPIFMTRPFASEGCASGCHFNHSLWNDKGENALYDPSKPNNMSDTYRFWIGGLIKHINALAVLCNPTPNCFRRLHKEWAPSRADWGIDNRMTTYRAKNQGRDGTYLESRLASSACNPYIVAAATIAAGLDGIENQIEPPEMGPESRDSNSVIPPYADCIEALKEDTILVKALGEEFIEWWLAMKQHELKQFGNIAIGNFSDEDLEAERNYYFELL